MGDWSLGSVAATVLDLVPDIPTAISGTRLLELADRKRQYVSEYTGVDIGSNSIGIKYQGTITNFTAAEVARLMDLQGADANNISLGDFSISKGGESNLKTMADGFHAIAISELKELGRRSLNYKSRG